jgi:hypothetical protein
VKAERSLVHDLDTGDITAAAEHPRLRTDEIAQETPGW